ncbi:MAG TPA: MFS transporter [Actinomycetales bacterium]|nr:MFS transporter [Actinomycetales bacterium]
MPEPALPSDGSPGPQYPFEGSVAGARALAKKPASRKEIVSWAFWDWGTQPFATVITTFVFAAYITGAPFGPENEVSQAHGLVVTIAGILVALMAPVLGQNSDRSGRTVRNLRNMTWVIALLSGALFFVKPEPAYLWVGLGIFGLGTLIDSIAGVNNNAILDDISTPENVGRISGFGWGMGYLGGIIVLLICALGFIMPRGTYWAEDGMGTRLSMVICMVWILVFTIPTFVNLKDKPLAGPPPKMGVVDSYKELGRTIARIWRQDRHTIYFLGASALFRDGLNGVFAFGAVIAGLTFGFSTTEVLMFGAAANIIAGIATIAFGKLDDLFGPKKVILFSLGSLVVLGILVFFLHDAGKLPFWIIGLMMTAFVGPTQSASRSFLARLVPEGKAGEVFGLYATTGRAISFVSPALYFWFIGIGAAVTGAENTQYWGILGIVIVLAAGFVMMLMVKDAKHHQQIAA